MFKQMELLDLSIQTLHTNDKKQPVMLEVLQLFSYETPSHIRIVNMGFQRLQDSVSGVEAQMLRMSGYQYRVQVNGEIFSPYSDGKQSLANYVENLNSFGFFKALEITNTVEDAETRTLSFALTAII